jgi:hypothetical protein
VGTAKRIRSLKGLLQDHKDGKCDCPAPAFCAEIQRQIILKLGERIRWTK